MTTQPGFPTPPVVPAAALADETLAGDQRTDADRVREEDSESEPTLVTTPDHLEREVNDDRPAGSASGRDDRLLGDDREVDLDDE